MSKQYFHFDKGKISLQTPECLIYLIISNISYSSSKNDIATGSTFENVFSIIQQWMVKILLMDCFVYSSIME